MTQRVSLDQLSVREPCHVSWDAMHNAASGRRFCDSCAKHVHDFSAMSRGEVEALLAVDGERPCVRFARGQDGRVLTRDDFAPTALPPSRRQWLRRVATLAATFGFGSLFNLGCDRVETGPPVTMGGIHDMPGPSTVPTTPPETVRGEVVMGDVALPIAGKPTIGEPTTKPTTMPTTQPIRGPIIGPVTTGMVAPFPRTP